MVETFTKRTVEESGQAPGYLGVQYTPDSFGATIGRALAQGGQTLAQVGANINALDRTKKVNDVQATINKAKDSVRPSFFDPEFGIYAQQGGNAMDVSKTARSTMDNAKKQYIQQLKDPGQQELFSKLWDNETDNALDKTANHEMRELGNYKVQVAKSTLTTSITDAYNNYNDPESLKKAIAEAEGVINLNSQGLPENALAAARGEVKSQITLAAISRWASESPDKALDFYTAHKEDLTGKDHVVATQLVNAAKDARDGQEDMARITKTGGLASGNLWNRLVQAESDGNNMAVSPDGALGASQVMPDTARYMLPKLGYAEGASLDDAALKKLIQTNPQLGERIGKSYLNEQLQKFNGDVEAALVAYNAGPARAEKFLKFNAGRPPGQRDYNVPGMDFLSKETEPYVKKILGSSGSTQSTPEGYRLSDNNWNLRNFQPDDLMAPTPGGRWVDARAAQALDTLQDNLAARFPGAKIKVNERGDTGGTQGKRRGTSDPLDNPHVAQSQHLKGRSFDIQVQGMPDEQKAALISEARQLGFAGFGFYGPKGHLHIDMGANRTWGGVPDWAKEALKTPVTAGPASSAAPTTSAMNNLPSSGSGLFGMGAAAPSGAFVSAKAPDLNSWLAEADAIPDPGRRARAKENIRLYAAQIETTNKAEVAALKQSAWEKVLSGSVKDLTSDVLAQLGPEFVSQLNTFETNRAKREMPMDWQAWQNIPVDPQELAKVDPYTEYRNKLDDSHFDRLITSWKEAQNKVSGRQADESLFEGMRSAQTVVNDTMKGLGWTDKNNASDIAKFSAVMDQRILGTQQELKRKLNATEIQDIADKLLIEGVTSTGYIYNSTGRAYTTQKPDEFIAAEAWDQVQEDDQRTLTQNYERRFGSPPDQEKATDLYNRSMRVFLGGQPDGPDEEKKLLRSALEAQVGRSIDDGQFKRAYSKFLLGFLGR